MSFSPELADIRFGCGLSPTIAPAASPQALLDGLIAPDLMAQAFPVETFETFRARMVEADENRKLMRETRGTPEFEQYKKVRNLLNKAAREAMMQWLGQTAMRWTRTDQGFRERLAFFWGDHFTAEGKQGVLRRATSPYIEEAIRPNMTGTFGELLIAAVTHPVMMHYLDQDLSVGPNSEVAIRTNHKRGLNENLAREVLELHTLGVDGPYTQDDVRQLAELFTGLTFQVNVGFKFNKHMAEPGAETVLGKTYGGDPAQLDAVLAALNDLAVHPATAHHIARKLAVHFVGDTPDPALVDHVTARFVETGGALMPVYEALLEHPSAWGDALNNVKPPADFMASACRALDVQPEIFAGMDEKAMRRFFVAPMVQMGQTWQQPIGPDGWPEEDEAWITPQGVAARMRWAMIVPRHMVSDRLPDPRQFVERALGPYASDPVRFAANAAENRPEAIGLVLASPQFQRR